MLCAGNKKRLFGHGGKIISSESVGSEPGEFRDPQRIRHGTARDLDAQHGHRG